jgi:LAS superfamily LD-carboxypeptidase LdcB
VEKLVGYTVVVLINRISMKIVNLLLILSLFISCKDKIQKKEPIQNKKIENINKQSNTDVKKNQSIIEKNIVLGKYNYRKNNNFIKVKNTHSSKTIYLNKNVYTSFIKMFKEAKDNNINLKIISGTRSFYEQKVIWERKWKKYNSLESIKKVKKILEFSSMPTTSRHHWGTDIDLNNLNNSYFEKGKGKKEYDWLVSNANKYDFYQVYTSKKNGRTGYNLEKWHWSYLPLASGYLKFYNENITYKDIKGFKGSELAKKTEIINNYVNGISEKIKEYGK